MRYICKRRSLRFGGTGTATGLLLIFSYDRVTAQSRLLNSYI
jgi:hypothetical protein